MRLLVAMSRKKLADHAREQGAARRDYRRSQASSQRERSIATSAADPSQQVATKELVEEIRRRLSEEERQLADLRVGGCTGEQIAAEQGESSEALRKKLRVRWTASPATWGWRSSTMSESDQLLLLCLDQRHAWQQGDHVLVEAYLEQQPTLLEDPEAVLDLIYNEIVLREESGEEAPLEQYLRRFPQFQARSSCNSMSTGSLKETR